MQATGVVDVARKGAHACRCDGSTPGSSKRASLRGCSAFVLHCGEFLHTNARVAPARRGRSTLTSSVSWKHGRASCEGGPLNARHHRTAHLTQRTPIHSLKTRNRQKSRLSDKCGRRATAGVSARYAQNGSRHHTTPNTPNKRRCESKRDGLVSSARLVPCRHRPCPGWIGRRCTRGSRAAAFVALRMESAVPSSMRDSPNHSRST